MDRLDKPLDEIIKTKQKTKPAKATENPKPAPKARATPAARNAAVRKPTSVQSAGKRATPVQSAKRKPTTGQTTTRPPAARQSATTTARTGPVRRSKTNTTRMNLVPTRETSRLTARETKGVNAPKARATRSATAASIISRKEPKGPKDLAPITMQVQVEIMNLDNNIVSQDLSEVLNMLGFTNQFTNIRVEGGGRAVVTFTSRSAAERGVLELDRRELDNRPLAVRVIGSKPVIRNR